MKKLCKVVMSFALVLSLTACGGNEDTSDSGKSSITFAKENDVITMNSMTATDGMSFEIIHATVDGLMDRNQDGELIPAIASEYTVSDDGLVYTFTLRDDAKWSNGDAVTAGGFEFAWKSSIVNPDAEYAYLYGSDGAAIAGADEILAGEADASTLGVTAIDDTTLEVKLSVDTPYFLSLMTFPVFYPVNQAFVEEQGDQYALTPENLLANGAYKMVTWEKGTKIVLEKNEDYYDADVVQTDELVFQITADVSSSATAYEAGQVDYTKLSSSLISKYSDTDEYTSVLEGYLWYLQFNYADEDLSNKNLRLAIAYALDKEDLTQNVLQDGSIPGNGFAPTDLAVGPDGADFRETAGEYLVPNTDTAQEYFDKALAELGTDEITITLLYENADPAKSAAEYLQSNLEQNLPGLTVELNQQTKESRLDLQKERDYEVVLTRWGPDYADPTTYLNLMITGNSYNYGDYSNPAYDALLDEAASAATPEERWTKLIEAEKLLMEDVPVVSVFQVGTGAVLREGIEGLIVTPVGVPYVYKYVVEK